MTSVTTELRQLIEEFSSRLDSVDDVMFAAKPGPARWSSKEVLGHLIDSAHNNLRRFLCGQYERVPPKITYEQNFWVTANSYQQANKKDLILLWSLLNQRICEILGKMPEAHLQQECDTGSDRVELHSLQSLAEDYVRHMKHHLSQIFPTP
jgi:hypothetical protein